MFTAPDPEEISISIEGETFRHWTEIEISVAFDGHASVSFSAPFEPDEIEFRETFRPFSFKEIEVLLGGDPLFSGTMIDVAPQVTAASRSVSVTAYSRAAVLAEVNVPAEFHPIEFNGLDLNQITEKLVAPFGLKLALGSASVGAKFERVALEPKDKIQEFLSDLAKQRGLVLGSDEFGDVIFRRSSAFGLPVAKLSDNQSPVVSVSPTFSPQSYFSEVTCLAKAKGGRGGSKYTAQNSYLLGVLRPSVIELDDTDPGDIEIATAARMGRMFGNMASYDIGLCTWFTPLGELYWPDDRIRLTAPGAMIYSDTELLVRAVKFSQSADQSRTASLTCCLPGAFSGEEPDGLPWLG